MDRRRLWLRRESRSIPRLRGRLRRRGAAILAVFHWLVGPSSSTTALDRSAQKRGLVRREQRGRMREALASARPRRCACPSPSGAAGPACPCTSPPVRCETGTTEVILPIFGRKLSAPTTSPATRGQCRCRCGSRGTTTPRQGSTVPRRGVRRYRDDWLLIEQVHRMASDHVAIVPPLADATETFWPAKARINAPSARRLDRRAGERLVQRVRAEVAVISTPLRVTSGRGFEIASHPPHHCRRMHPCPSTSSLRACGNARSAPDRRRRDTWPCSRSSTACHRRARPWRQLDLAIVRRFGDDALLRQVRGHPLCWAPRNASTSVV